MTSTSEATERPFTLLERYCLTRELIGYPQSLTTIVTYPLSSLPSFDFMATRIGELQAHYPALYARVVDRKTKYPKWRVGEVPWPASAILSTVDLAPGDDAETLIKREMERFKDVDLDQGVYWNVRRHVPSGGNGNGIGYITLSTAHTLMDGRAMLAVTQALLAAHPPTTSEPAISIPLDAKEFTPGMAEVVPLVWSNLVRPRLPVWIQNRLPREEPTWPNTEQSLDPAKLVDCPGDISLLSISAPLTAQIKSAAKDHQASLQICLKVAFLMALWKVLRPAGEPLNLSGVTPRDDRSLPSHSKMTGAFASATTLSTSFSPSTPYWDLVGRWTAILRDPDEPARGRRKTGVLSYIPDPANFSSPDPRRHTGWEDFWLDKLEGKGSNPTGDSVEFSNLGATSLTPGATDLAWLQPPNPVGGAIRTGVVGHEGGLRCIFVWREGYCLTREQMKRVEEVFVCVLERVVAGGKETAGELTK